MKKFLTVLFDLDGTITDPGVGITNSVMHALKYYGIEETDRTRLYRFIGPPLAESFERFYGISGDEAYRAVDHYREYYTDKGIFENEVYEGIPELLRALKRNGFTVGLATSKPEIFANRILEHFELDGCFDCVTGSELDGRRVRKSDVINEILRRLGLTDLTGVVMVGDREHDIIGAKESGVTPFGVLYGYGSREELETAGAVRVVESPAELQKLLIG